jgi:glycosyltransferase involved in cell wall biosynthesis
VASWPARFVLLPRPAAAIRSESDLSRKRPDVVFDADAFTRQPFGGVTRYFVQLNRALQRLGVDSRIIAPLHVNRYLAADPSQVGRFVANPSEHIRQAARWLSAGATVPLRPRVVHKTWYMRRTVTLPETPVVITVHDLTHELYPESFVAADRTVAMRAFWIERASHIMAVSENTAADLIRIYGVSRERITVTPLASGLDATEAATAPGDWPARWVLYVGGRDGYKNFETAVDAFAVANLAGVHLMAFGAPPSDAELSLVSRRGLTGRCVWVSGGDALLARAYRDAVALIYPSLYEGFGIPPLEAMTCGCPVIAADRASIPEVVGDAGILVDPGDVDAIAATLRSVEGDTELATSLRRRGLARAEGFTWERTARATISGYRAGGATSIPSAEASP